ncbi:hypothetical protein [Vibrio sagamiensis]|uniref:Uncharacterized protein n=1 Tax=Vibrio sagamiensis NBRC 104589 TaxID=1219064 RepID=A0A511QFW9_9VIBR|nr:hypothetical protein [Vibrio sagamiensis]GEM76199.1 hypothetical protein VSA01S_23110 [Vibrio sagamiensis NBRC 104589]
MNSGKLNEQIKYLVDDQKEVSMVEKLKAAYITAREQLELTEVELNRSKVVVIDENGHMTKVTILLEH